MSTGPENLMAGYLLGELFADERARIDAIMATGAVTPVEAATLEAVHSIALYTIPTRPSPRVRENLLASLNGRMRYLPFLQRVADLLDIDADMAQTILTTVDHRVGWTEDDDGVRTRAVPAGPKLRGVQTALIRASAGTVLPRPSPATSARLLVLAGELRDDDGRLAGAGDQLRRPNGSRYRHEVHGRDEAIVLQITREDDESAS
ncbi:MAG: hypothetical protein R3B09_25430 [Nannocystaceae bacterium]